MYLIRLVLWTCSFIVLLTLSGCGGGGSSTLPSDTTSSDDGEITEHLSLVYDGTNNQCLQCHREEALEVHSSVHYQWKGNAEAVLTGPSEQGKIAGAVNSYCINIMGNWQGCGKCHIGRGAIPEESPTDAGLENIDCLMCHQSQYKRQYVDGRWVMDEQAMSISPDEAVRTVHSPTREDCLRCHAFAGGGDAVKRGDITQAHSATADRNFDVHMSTTGANLTCVDCHSTDSHKIAGRGSDLRPVDNPAQVTCSNCHADKATRSGHESSDINRHVARVACQTCHIPFYAKNATDTTASEATETHRSWRSTHSTAAPYHPYSVKENFLTPKYRFYNGTSICANTGESIDTDGDTGNYPTSRPLGDIDDSASRLYAFKFKTAEQPRVNRTGEFLALDTSVYFATGDGESAAKAGLTNMGYADTEPYSWILSDTYQMLNHTVGPHDNALDCADCHGSTSRMDLQGELGYELKQSQASLCSSCHSYRTASFSKVHDEHVREEQIRCSTCHNFSRPERYSN